MSGMAYDSRKPKRPFVKEPKGPKVICDLPAYSRLATYQGKLLCVSEEGTFEITPRGLVEFKLDE